jgi:hypothetical protein
MEIQLLLGLMAIGVIAYLLLSKRKPAEVAVTLPVVETAVQPPVETVVETVVAVNPVAVALDLEPAAVEAPVAIETPAKKPRKPRSPKAAPAEKPAAKKAAPVKKAAAIKAAPKAKSKKA